MYISKVKMPEVVNDEMLLMKMKYTKTYIYKQNIRYTTKSIYVCIDRVCVYVYFTFNLSQHNSFFALLSRLSVLLNHTRYNIIISIYNV